MRFGLRSVGLWNGSDGDQVLVAITDFDSGVTCGSGILFFSLLFLVHPLIVLGFNIAIPICSSIICRIVPFKVCQSFYPCLVEAFNLIVWCSSPYVNGRRCQFFGFPSLGLFARSISVRFCLHDQQVARGESFLPSSSSLLLALSPSLYPSGSAPPCSTSCFR